MSIITLSKGVPQDAETLAQIKQRIWLDTYQNKEFGIDAQDVYDKDFLCEERIAKRAEHMQIDDGINYTLVARDGDQIVGYGRAVKGSEQHEIVTLYILPEWQGNGIGTMLLQHLLDWLGTDQDIILGVVPYNDKAIRFYEKFGFKRGKSIPHDKPTFPSGKDLPELEMMLVSSSS